MATKENSKIPQNYKRIEGSERKIAPGDSLVGAANPKEILTVTIALRRRPDAPSLPDAAYWAATHPSERKYITVEELHEKYGAIQSDADSVVKFAQNNGLKVIETDLGKKVVIVSGTVEQMNKAFGVTLSNYKTENETYRGREGHVYIPNHLADIIQGVFGLDNRQVVKRSNSTPAPGGGGTSALTPAQVAKLYKFPTGINASHQTIGILEYGGGYHMSDVNKFFHGQHLTPPSVVSVGVDGVINTPGGGADIEVILDIDVAGSAAQGAKIAVYFAPNSEAGFYDSVIAAIHDTVNKPSVLSISWCGKEDYAFSQAAILALDVAYLEAASLGVTIFAASGDWGSQITGGKPTVNYPASDPWVTGCGGTSISNVSGINFTEDTWPGTGGGVSVVFPLPMWQLGVNVPGNGRGVPDVAGNADPNSGYVLIYNGVNTGPWGGTSAVAPLYAGLVALLNAALGHKVGYLNPIFYKLHGAPYFRDINDGISNGTFISGPGWDACTGWGSPDGIKLLNFLKPTELCGEGLKNTGMVCEIIYDCFGDFQGFVLDTCCDRHLYKCREKGINEIVLRACKERLLISVFAKEKEHIKIQKIVIQA